MGSVSVQEFMAQNHQKKGRTSKLAPFSKDILLLINNGYSQNQILDYLRQNGLIVGLTTLNAFIKKNHQAVVAGTNTAATDPQHEMTQTAKTETEKSKLAAPKKGIRKFDWKNATTDGLI